MRREAAALVLVEVDGNHEAATDFEARRIWICAKVFLESLSEACRK